MFPDWLCSCVEDYSTSNRAPASWATFLVWCGFALSLATAPQGWDSGLQSAAEIHLQMLETGTFSIPHHPEARKTSRAQWFNRRLLARLSFKFLWAACPVSGTHRFGVLVTPCRFFEALQKADTCKLHRLSWSMGYLEPAVWHSLFVILGQPSWKKLLQTKLRVLLATCCSLLSLPFKSGCAEGAYRQGTQFCQMLTGNNYWSQQEADQLYPKILFPTKEENPDKMYLVVNIPAANSLYKIVSISHVL